MQKALFKYIYICMCFVVPKRINCFMWHTVISTKSALKGGWKSTNVRRTSVNNYMFTYALYAIRTQHIYH